MSFYQYLLITALSLSRSQFTRKAMPYKLGEVRVFNEYSLANIENTGPIKPCVLVAPLDVIYWGLQDDSRRTIRAICKLGEEDIERVCEMHEKLEEPLLAKGYRLEPLINDEGFVCDIGRSQYEKMLEAFHRGRPTTLFSVEFQRYNFGKFGKENLDQQNNIMVKCVGICTPMSLTHEDVNKVPQTPSPQNANKAFQLKRPQPKRHAAVYPDNNRN